MILSVYSPDSYLTGERPNISPGEMLGEQVCELVTGNHYDCPVYANKLLVYVIKYI